MRQRLVSRFNSQWNLLDLLKLLPATSILSPWNDRESHRGWHLARLSGAGWRCLSIFASWPGYAGTLSLVHFARQESIDCQVISSTSNVQILQTHIWLLLKHTSSSQLSSSLGFAWKSDLNELMTTTLPLASQHCLHAYLWLSIFTDPPPLVVGGVLVTIISISLKYLGVWGEDNENKSYRRDMHAKNVRLCETKFTTIWQSWILRPKTNKLTCRRWRHLALEKLLSPWQLFGNIFPKAICCHRGVERIHTSNFQLAAIFANHQKNSFQKLNAKCLEVWLFWSICCCCALISNTAWAKMRLSFVPLFATPLSCVHVSVFASISQINSPQSHITKKTLNSQWHTLASMYWKKNVFFLTRCLKHTHTHRW